MSRRAVIFTTVTHFKCHHEDRIEALLLFLHVLELICLSLVGDELDVLNRGELGVLITSRVYEYWLIHSQFFNTILPLGKGAKLDLLVNSWISDLDGCVVVVELVAHQLDCCCFYPI